jgi:tetratricopeptide (TPR) repeat protein
LHCIEPAMLKYIPDDLSLGALYFHLGETQLYSSQFSAANENFDRCLHTHWVDTNHNRFLATFAKAKALQALQEYEESIHEFTKALEMKPENPFCHFRRAWSYKVFSDFTCYIRRIIIFNM